KATTVYIKPACPGSGIIAGGPVRAILECAGYTDIISKSVGSRTSVNVVRAVFDGLGKLLDAAEIAKNRGKTLKDVWS
ncbi:MAG: 30S ribosomal protein S5, partial [Rectinemataceae bacterium]